MSKPSCDLNAPSLDVGGVLCADHLDLPGAPPPSPSGRVFYENLGIRIDKDGIWHYHGSPIRRKELVCLFASALSRDGSGRYWLVTSTEMGPIDVEDAPLLAVEMFIGGEGEQQIISLRTNVDEIVSVDAEHPLHVERDAGSGEAIPYVRLDKQLEARVTRAVYYELAAHAVEAEIAGRHCLGVWSRGRLFTLGWLDEAP
ncbi:MAG TPA: DUF1285 domain-containing protein [Rhodospirillales bacterium]|nr:DUF1285 domain-containing protein [Rhodospirillales bacterium]